MKVTYISSACVLIQSGDTKVLCDPWLVSGAYYGSWCHYPALKVTPEDFNDVDYMYISHIHQDHFDIETLKRMDKRIPVLINTYESKFLKVQLEKLGYNVRELKHNDPHTLNDNFTIRILSADNCNPELCAKFLGCAFVENKFKNTQIDSMCVFEDGTHTVVNVNDCPWELAATAAKTIKDTCGKIDFLLVGYLGASPYPQCFKISDQSLNQSIEDKTNKFYNHTKNYINIFNPDYYMPFAGRYVLGGRLWKLNDRRGDPELEEAYNHFTACKDINGQCVILNRNSWFDVGTGEASEKYINTDISHKRQYIKDVLSKIQFDYEHDALPPVTDIMDSMPDAYDRFNSVRKQIGFNSKTSICIPLINDKILKISCSGKGYEIVEQKEEPYFEIDIDMRLLKRALLGPRHAHWNNIEIGSHALFEKKPDIYERGLYYSLCYLHK